MTDLELARESLVPLIDEYAESAVANGLCNLAQIHVAPAPRPIKQVKIELAAALSSFAARIRQEEREACMLDCISVRVAYEGDFDAELAATECAAAIRARGESQ